MPDFLVELVDETFLVVEVKGLEREQDRSKEAGARVGWMRSTTGGGWVSGATPRFICRTSSNRSSPWRQSAFQRFDPRLRLGMSHDGLPARPPPRRQQPGTDDPVEHPADVGVGMGVHCHEPRDLGGVEGRRCVGVVGE